MEVQEGLQEVTLTLISHKKRTYEKDGEKQTVVNCSIKTEEYGDEVWIGGWESDTTYGWRVGQMVELDLEIKGDFVNFKAPNQEKKLKEELDAKDEYIKKLQAQAAEAGVEPLPF